MLSSGCRLTFSTNRNREEFFFLCVVFYFHLPVAPLRETGPPSFLSDRITQRLYFWDYFRWIGHSSLPMPRKS